MITIIAIITFLLAVGSLFMAFKLSHNDFKCGLMATNAFICITICLSVLGDPARVHAEEKEGRTVLTHMGLEYYIMNGDNTTTDIRSGRIYHSEVVPTSGQPRLELYKDGKKVKSIALLK